MILIPNRTLMFHFGGIKFKKLRLVSYINCTQGRIQKLQKEVVKEISAERKDGWSFFFSTIQENKGGAVAPSPLSPLNPDTQIKLCQFSDLLL